MMYHRVHVVKPTFWHVEGIQTGSHHSSASLGLSFMACESVQRAAISVRHHLPVQNVIQLRYTPLVLLVRISKLVLHIFTYPLNELGGQVLQHRVELMICSLEPHFVLRS